MSESPRPEHESPDDGEGQVSDTQGAGPVSDGDTPAGDLDLAEGEQSRPATEPEESDDHEH